MKYLIGIVIGLAIYFIVSKIIKFINWYRYCYKREEFRGGGE